jgi:hypothetical protein
MSAPDRRARGGPRTREAVDAWIADTVPDGGRPVDHLRLARRGRGGPPQALGVRPAVVAVSWHRVADTDVWHLTLSCRRVARRVQARGRPPRPRRVDPGSAQPQPGPRSVRRQLGGPRHRLRGAGLDPPRSRTAPPGRIDEIFIDSKTFGRRGFGLYVPARFRRSRRYPLLVVHDGHDYLRYASLQHGPRQPDRPARDRRRDRGADQLARSPARVRRRRAPRRFLTEELVPYVERRLPLERGAAEPLPDGRQLRRGGGAVDGVPLPRLLRPAAAAVGLVRLHRHRRATAAARCSTRWSSS